MESKKILVVNEKENAEFLVERILKNTGPIIVIAHNKEDAIIQSLNEKFDLVIINTQLPGLNSFLAADFIRKQLNTKNIPIIFTSSNDEDRLHINDRYEDDSVDLLLEPFKPRELRKKVCHYLNKDEVSMN